MKSHLKKAFLKYRWEIFGFLLLLCVVSINRFPGGYVIAGEDLFQHINLQEHYRQMFYDWQGRASLFYSIFYLLDWFGISETAQLSGYLGIFLVGAYLSFLGFLYMVFKKTEGKIATAGALFYALNLYTLYVFTYTWGYSDFQMLYAFIPVLTGTYVAFLRSQRTYYGALFLSFLFFASSGFSNPAFALSFFIFLFFLTASLILVRLVAYNHRAMIRVLILGLLSFLISAYWILPIVPQVSKGVSDLSETNSIDLGAWLQKTSNPISETIRLGQFNSGSFFPRNNPYTDFDFIKPLILSLSFLPIILIFSGMWRGGMRAPDQRKVFFGFLTLLIVFVALNARVRPPFDGLNAFIFHLPGLNTLRSYEKIAIFTPFILAVLLTMTLMRPWVGRSRRFVIVGMVLILLLPLPFYTGKLQQNMSFIFAQRSKDFHKSSHSFLVKIPQEYYDIRGIINSDPEQFKIASLPYNTDKRGWVSYPEWKMRGSDITAALYKAPLLNPNSLYIGQWLFSNDFNEQAEDPLWIVELLGILNTKYIIYHKDIHEEFLDKSLEKILHLKSQGVLTELTNNGYFTLYKVKGDYVAPYTYFNKEKAVLSEYSVQGVLESGEKLRRSWDGAPYQILHPKKVVVSLLGNPGGGQLVLSEQHDLLWRAVYHDGEKRVVLERDPSITYANAWRIDKNMENGLVMIEYLPMKLFFIGAWISGSVLFIVVIYLTRSLYARRRKNGHAA